jgi:hypothetical protein
VYSTLHCLANTFASGINAKGSAFKNSSLSPLLNNFTNGCSQGESGGIYSVLDPLPVHHSRSAWAMNSGPWAIRRRMGAGYCLAFLDRNNYIQSLAVPADTNGQTDAAVCIHSIQALQPSAIHRLVKLEVDRYTRCGYLV